MTADILITIILLLILGAAISYIIKEKKRGTKCIGCPAAGSCPSRNAGKAACSCASQNDTKGK